MDPTGRVQISPAALNNISQNNILCVRSHVGETLNHQRQRNGHEPEAANVSYDSRKAAGILVFAGGAQFVLGMLIAETLHPGYSVAQNYISDLGVGPAAAVFNSSAFLLGLMVVGGAYFAHRTFHNRLVTSLLVLSGIGAMGVGIFPEDIPVMHEIVSVVAFISGGLAPIAACKLQKKPLNYLSIVMGLFSLSALILLSAQYTFGLGEQYFLGLGPGGIERMIVYPILLWQTTFGGYLIGSS